MIAQATHRRTDLVGAAAVFATTLLVNLLSASPGLVPVTGPDTVGYLEVAQQLVQGEAPYLHARTLGYPVFLALAALTGSWQRIVWIQSVIAALAAVTLWWILREPASPRAPGLASPL
jgi:hypothetical protein